MIPSNMVLPCRGVRKTTEDINIRTKAAKMNQKEPMSNIVPNKDTWELPEKREERRKTRTMPSPEARRADLGKIIFPSENRAMAQKITESASPATKSSPLEVSTGDADSGTGAGSCLGTLSLTRRGQGEVCCLFFDKYI